MFQWHGPLMQNCIARSLYFCLSLFLYIILYHYLLFKKIYFRFFLLINVCYYCLIFLSVLDYTVLIFKYICKTSNLAENPLTTIQDITDWI